MQTISVKKTSITSLETEIIVNAANEHLHFGSGVCGYIFKAAGVKKLEDACNRIGYCPAGKAVITPGFSLCKYIVHAVGPIWNGGNQNEPEKLYGCYQASMDLAEKNGCHSIGFPLISAGIFGYPKDQAWHQAICAVRDWFSKNPKYRIDVVFAALDDEIVEMGKQTVRDIAPEYYKTSKGDWTIFDMPDQHEVFTLEKVFTEDQMAALQKGNLPKEMEDKWFLYMEGNKFFAHRSWTGYCIYLIEFSKDHRHKVTVNRDPEQYGCTSISEDRNNLNELLNWWTQSSYDHYGEWLHETVKTLTKAGMIRNKLKVGDHSFDAIFFHKPEEPNGYLSNWYPSPFELNGIEFSSCEQYIMYRKCILFGDKEAGKAVLETDDTAKQQKIGRNAKGFVPAVWDGIKQAVLMNGIAAKFEQNEDLKKQLLATENAYLVECARTDHIWACGRRLDDNRRFDLSEWAGQNLLGFSLMEIRERLKG